MSDHPISAAAVRFGANEYDARNGIYTAASLNAALTVIDADRRRRGGLGSAGRSEVGDRAAPSRGWRATSPSAPGTRPTRS
jgi:hypothetical protein